MIHLEKTNRLANWFIAIGVLFALFTFFSFLNGGFFEVMQYNFVNDLRGTLFTVLFFIISFFSIVIAIVLKCIVKEVNDELTMLAERIKND
ncbi:MULTISPECIES: hypothetical protein [unclassified Paenibacillus]|uniref:hypothetical protein n=1 Tax=unclassified Paenibacillus TaxID=185978 RepID=UPI002F3E220A